MEAKGKMVNPVVIFLLASLVSLAYSHRLANHFYFSFTRNYTTTTSSPTDSVIVGDKMKGPSVKVPSRGDSFLNKLLNRPTYFNNNGGSGQNNDGGNNDKNAMGTSKPTTEEPTNIFAGVVTDTTTSPTPATIPTTTRTVTTTRGNNFFNEDSSPNQNRPGMLVYNDKQPTETRDRQSSLHAAEQWLQRFRRPSVLEPVQSRSRSQDANSDSTHKVDIVSMSPAPSRPTSSVGNNNGAAVQIDPNGAVYIVKGRPTAGPSQVVGEGDRQGPGPVDVQDKPFYGSSQGWFSSDERSSEGGFDTTVQNNGNEAQYNFRYKRADNSNSADVNGTSCSQTSQFPSCQFLPRCFPKLVDSCSTRDSFMGDKFNRFCVRAIEATKSVQSDILKTYVTNLVQCVQDELSLVLESPSCDDVTSVLTEALLTKRRSNCLYQGGLFCNITADEAARPALARLLNLPTSDVHFMSRLLITFGDMTYFCRGKGSSVLITDLMTLATSADSPYKNKFSNTPIPGISVKH